MVSKTLYDLKAQYALILQLAESDEGDFSQALTDTEGELAEKLESYAIVDLELEATEAKLKAEIERLSARKKRITKNRESLKNAMHDALQLVEGNKLQTEKFTFSFRPSQAVNVLDENLVPRQFIKPGKPSLDVAAIKEKLKAGETVQGAELIENKNLQVK